MRTWPDVRISTFPPLKREGRIVLSEAKNDTGRDHHSARECKAPAHFPSLEKGGSKRAERGEGCFGEGSERDFTRFGAVLPVHDESPQARLRGSLSDHGLKNARHAHVESTETWFSPYRALDCWQLRAGHHRVRQQVSPTDSRNRGYTVPQDADAGKKYHPSARHADETRACTPLSSNAAVRSARAPSFHACCQIATLLSPYPSSSNLAPSRRQDDGKRALNLDFLPL